VIISGRRSPARPAPEFGGTDRRYPTVPVTRPAPERGLIMKVRNSLRSLKAKPGSVVTRRRGRQVVVNRKNPRWNGRQG
jgi:large subunit ribosomal protein L36